MKATELRGATAPVLLKTSRDQRWPDDERLFYVLARDGLYRMRNHEFFQSCVKTDAGPSGLEEQREFLRARFPLIPRALFEEAVGFFARVAEHQGSEAAALLLWDRTQQQVQIVVPPQTATMMCYWDGYRSPIGVHYELPADLPADWIPFGDLHSHVFYAAYASATDVEDETHAAGLHIVVGHIDREPPDFHAEVVVDGQRFKIALEAVIEGYQARREDVPAEWLDRVVIQEQGTGSVGRYPRSVS